jgi:predicted RNase H-like HicB family nuclease
MQRQFDVVIERDEDGYYVASVPQLPGCHTQARSLDELTERIREAVGLCLEAQGAPEQILEFIGIQRITIAALAGVHARRALNCLPRLPSVASRRSARKAAITFYATRMAGVRWCLCIRAKQSGQDCCTKF